MLIAALFKQETLSLAKSLGVLLTLAGVGLALGEGASTDAAYATWRVDLIVLLSALAAAVCTLLYRPYLKKYPSLQVSTYGMTASVLFLGVLAAGEGLFAASPSFTPRGWVAILVIGITSGLGYFL